MKLPLINAKDAEMAQQKLSHYYDEGLIPAEKKSYLSDLRHGQGPYLGVKSAEGKTHYLLDAASQIATLGLGFNPTAFFGTAHFEESFTNNQKGEEFLRLRKGLKRFFERKLGVENIDLNFCNSGAEANELALGQCFAQRAHQRARRVLAFEGSFHGRLQVALSSTWNPQKRATFEWPNFKTEFLPFPENKSGEVDIFGDASWIEAFSWASQNDFSAPDSEGDPLLAREIEILLQVRKKLISNDFFAIIIEPMQCEGGDRYSSARFNQALLLMAKSFRVPLIFDEVQTGMHLGRQFFWHREFRLQNRDGSPLAPDFVTCAKKAQSAIVISMTRVDPLLANREFQVASVIRGHAHALSLEQFGPQILELEKKSLVRLQALVKKYSHFLEFPRARGMCFAVDLKDAVVDKLNAIIAERFNYGLLFYPAGERTLRFRVNCSFCDADFDFLFQSLGQICAKVFLNETQVLPLEVERPSVDTDYLYTWHELIVLAKLGGPGLHQKAIDHFFLRNFGLKFVSINAKNFPKYQQTIEEIQKNSYEPQRQTPLSKFKLSLDHPMGIGLGLLNADQQLVAICFASPLCQFPSERGVLRDPFFQDENALYMLDTTVVDSHKGQGLGKYLKYALVLMASERGAKRLHGRNRSILAAPMLAINLSLGAYELEFVQDDYLDDEDHRDVYYYSAHLHWQNTALGFSSGVESPQTNTKIEAAQLANMLPSLINKVCLSNFVSQTFLENLATLSCLMPKELRHVLSASGQAECLDKIVKTLWIKTEDKQQAPILWSFKDSYFGLGSFIARSLDDRHEAFFPTHLFDFPTLEHWPTVLSSLEEQLKKERPLGIFIEPFSQRKLQRIPQKFLAGLRIFCTENKIPLIYNETLSALYAYSDDSFYASSDKAITPDCAFHYLGGQGGICYFQKEFFVDTPLSLISTWDGDEWSFERYIALVNQYSKEQINSLRQNFSDEFTKLLAALQVNEVHLQQGLGHFQGHIPHSLQARFHREGNSYRVVPSLQVMERLIKKGWEL